MYFQNLVVRLSFTFSKGQLISESNNLVLNSSKKRTKNWQFFQIFHSFFGIIENKKNAFEIIWPTSIRTSYWFLFYWFVVSIIFYPSIVKAKDDAPVKPEEVKKEEPAKKVSILSFDWISKRLIFEGTFFYDLSNPLSVMNLGLSLNLGS